MRELEGKNILITGAGGGIGTAALEKLASNGGNIWACSHKKSDEFENKILELAEKNHVWIKPVYFDLKDEQAVKEEIASIAKEKLPIDVLINNAGMAHGGVFQMTSMETLKEVFQINFFSQIYITQLVSRLMMRRKRGVIINMASVGGIEAAEGYIAYGSSKAALIYATKALSKELGNMGIRVNAIAPGLVNTRMGHYKSDKEIERVLERTVLNRMAEPEEIAEAMVYLASDKAAFITGQVLVIDGGRLQS